MTEKKRSPPRIIATTRCLLCLFQWHVRCMACWEVLRCGRPDCKTALHPHQNISGKSKQWRRRVYENSRASGERLTVSGMTVIYRLTAQRRQRLASCHVTLMKMQRPQSNHGAINQFFFTPQKQNLKNKWLFFMQKSQWLAFSPCYSFKIFHFQFSSTVSQDLNELVWPFCINMIGDHLLHFSCKSYPPSVGSAEFLTQVLTDLSPRRVTYDCGCCCFNSCTVYAEADGRWILSNLHEARGWVI